MLLGLFILTSCQTAGPGSGHTDLAKLQQAQEVYRINQKCERALAQSSRALTRTVYVVDGRRMFRCIESP